MNHHNFSEEEQTQLLMKAITQFIEKPVINDALIESFAGLTGNFRKIGEYLGELFFYVDAQKNEQIQKRAISLPNLEVSAPKTVLLFDDNRARLQLLAKRLNEQRDLTVLETYVSAHRAVEACRRWSPDFVVMDVQMPDGDGITAAQKIATQCPSTIKVVLISENNAPYGALQSMAAGAKGYLTKVDGINNLPFRLRMIANGDFVMNQEIRDAFLTYMHYRGILTVTQMKVLGHIIESKTRDQMEKDLKMSKEALRQNIYRIGKLLGVKEGEVGIREHFWNRNQSTQNVW